MHAADCAGSIFTSDENDESDDVDSDGVAEVVGDRLVGDRLVGDRRCVAENERCCCCKAWESAFLDDDVFKGIGMGSDMFWWAWLLSFAAHVLVRMLMRADMSSRSDGDLGNRTDDGATAAAAMVCVCFEVGRKRVRQMTPD